MKLLGSAYRIPFQDNSFATVITSPPYWGKLVNGTHPDEIGPEVSLADYIVQIRYMAREISRVLDPIGVFWLNMGDTYSGSGGAGGDYNPGGSREGLRKWKQGPSGLPAMTQCLVPFRVATALQNEGWLVRKVIIWDKLGVIPEDKMHVNRPLNNHEYIFMLTRNRVHRFNSELLGIGNLELGDVWHFQTSRGKRGHPTPFPAELPRRCIQLSTFPGMRVLDPCGGSGTTAQVAEELGRVGYTMDLYA